MNKLRLIIALAFTVVTLSHSRPSQAAVSIFTGGATAIVGLKVIAVGGVMFAAPFVLGRGCGQESCNGLRAAQFLGLLLVPVGLIILDGDQSVTFTEIDKQSAQKIGITEKERQSFNSEIDQVNMLLAEVAHEVEKVEEATPQDAASVWNDVQNLVSPQTFSAMTKIASQK